MSEALVRWLDDVTGRGWIWYAKYLSANDTGATGGKAAGLYIPKAVFQTLFPTITAERGLNPSRHLKAIVVQEGIPREVRAIWYNNQVVGQGTRNECRITGWGGTASPLLDPEATGSIVVLAFHRGATGDSEKCRVWVCSSPAEEEVVADRIGFVEPGSGILVGATGEALPDPRGDDLGDPCAVNLDQLPESWTLAFPEPMELVSASVTRVPNAHQMPPDGRLMRRSECEYVLFRTVEAAHVMPRVREGFHSVEQFVSFAGAVTNRRKARAGRSLELQLRQILEEEGIHYSHGEVSESGKRPDFVFPSIASYRDAHWPNDRLLMLAAKTTCKDRWRQVIDEADRIPVKHLLTLQEGVSINQFRQMEKAGIRLVVPKRLHEKYPREVRDSLLTIADFLAAAGNLQRVFHSPS